MCNLKNKMQLQHILLLKEIILKSLQGHSLMKTPHSWVMAIEAEVIQQLFRQEWTYSEDTSSLPTARYSIIGDL